MNVLQKAKNFYTQHQNVLGYSTVSLATVGIEQIFSSVVFQCPCNSASENMLYGLSFLLAPAFILLLIGYMVNAKMWLLLTAAIMTLFFLKLFGWLLIAAIMTVALISTCFSHCCSTTSYLQLKFWKMYSKTERELFETKAKEHAKNLAERNTECFFEAIDPAPFHTPSRENWQKISILYTFNSQEQYYSMLHKYANTNIYKSTKFKKEGQDHTVSPFVEEAQAEF
ncbi:PREDICTED: protein FAM26F-like [Ficedula albicollis]|uniref:protein FAM26F-like n=1 Tax=Ficedula albicollis TaxID=59894 RepID=UPI0007AD79B7|nr:PREDICTED: protein FAM26F-like [Ficedula albicollis]